MKEYTVKVFDNGTKEWYLNGKEVSEYDVIFKIVGKIKP